MTTVTLFAVRPLRDAWRWLRHAVPLLRGHAGRHIGAVLDLDWVDQLHAMQERRRRDRPVYTPPVKLRVDLPCMAAGSWSSAPPLEPLPPMNLPALETGPAAPPRGTHGVMAVRQAQGGEPDLPEPEPRATACDHRLGEPADAAEVLAPQVYAALAAATSPRDTIVRYIEQLAGGDVYDGLGQDAYLDQLFPGLAATP